MDLTIDKNMIDKDEYPQTAELEMRCVHMLADLWNSPDADRTRSACSTTGSSEAAMLGGLALLWTLAEAQRKAEGKPVDKPNLVTGITSRSAGTSSPATGTSRCARCPWRATAITCTPEEAVKRCRREHHRRRADPGLTFTGQYEPVKRGLSDALDDLQASDRPRHPHPRRRRQRRLPGAVSSTGPGVGLPPAAREVDQRLRPQVRPGAAGRRLGRSGATPRTCPRT